MAKTYRPYLPDQILLLPPSLRDWLPDNHLAYFLSDLIDQLDLRAIEGPYEQEERGYPPYHPRMMTKILVYGYCVGVFSSRRLQKRLQEDVAFRVLAAGNEPDFRTISDFRKIHLQALEGLFRQVLRMALELGAMKVGRVAIDGSKLGANASKHKAMSYQRMKEQEKRLREEVRRLLQQAEAMDAAEDAEYGPKNIGDELPAELARREERLQRIREAKRALEERARAEANKQDEDQDADPPVDGQGGKRHERKNTKGKPKLADQYNFTDPQSRIMKGPDGFVQAYNAQIAVEPMLQLIVGQAVTQQENDKKQLLPMIATVQEQAGEKPTTVLADNGYFSEQNLNGAAKLRVEAYIAVGKDKHNQSTPPCPRGPIPRSATLLQRMHRKLQTIAGRAIYARRKVIVEPVFGQIKQGQGFRRFLLRGIQKVQGEWALVCMTHNLLKLHRACCLESK
jgi:transposase